MSTRGAFLVCLRNLDLVAIVDLEAPRVVWSWGAGELQRPHHPSVTREGRILVFDNGQKRGYSRVLEVDPASDRIVWQYAADPPRRRPAAERRALRARHRGMLAPMARPSLELKRRTLGRAPLFSGLAPKQLDALASVARTRTLEPREELFHKGDEGTEVCVVVEGRLKVLATSADGDDLVFGILGPGEMLGEISLLADCRRTATVVALDRCTLLVIDRREFMPFLGRHPQVAVQLLRVLAERLRRVSELLEDALFLNLPFRLAKKLCAFADAYGKEVDGEVRIDLKLSQEEWGDLVGATRESINKQIRAWSDAGLVHLEGGYVVIRDPQALERLADCVIT